MTNMSEQQQMFIECFKIAADFCGRSNESDKYLHYSMNDFKNLALDIAKTVGIIQTQ